MEKELAQILFQGYLKKPDCLLKLKLRGGKTKIGRLIGFQKSDPDWGNSIRSWLLVNEKSEKSFGIDAFGFLDGCWIEVKEIIEVEFISASVSQKNKRQVAGKAIK